MTDELFHSAGRPGGRSTVRGRGAHDNPPNRFEPILIERDPEYDDSEDPALKTECFNDTTKSIITFNKSPDVGFEASVNPYRGCEHGCVYCYARPGHEYFGLSAGLDFETKIFAKRQAPALLEKELMKRTWKPQTLVMSGVTDPYQPIERRLEITRGCLEVLSRLKHPVAVITKNHLVTRDVDLLRPLAAVQAAGVFLSITTLDANLARRMEPRASTPGDRLAAVRRLRQAGIPVGVMVAPVVPGLTDHELPAILKAAVEAGAQSAGYVVLRLPYAVKDLFTVWVERFYPERKNKILNRLKELRGGKLYDAEFGSRMKGEGVFAEQIKSLFQAGCRRAGLKNQWPVFNTDAFQGASSRQYELF